jgi:hypothetical protein
VQTRWCWKSGDATLATWRERRGALRLGRLAAEQARQAAETGIAVLEQSADFAAPTV